MSEPRSRAALERAGTGDRDSIVAVAARSRGSRFPTGRQKARRDPEVAAEPASSAVNEPFGMPRSQIRRVEIRASRELLLELAERVDSRGPIGVEGLALTSLLTREGLPDGQHHRQLER